jgi:hypothetical protein
VRVLRQRHLSLDVLDDVVDVPPQQLDPPVVRPAPRGEGLAHPDRAERVDAGEDRLAVAQEGDVGAAASDLHEERPPPPEHLVVPQRLADGEIVETVLFRSVDDSTSIRRTRGR